MPPKYNSCHNLWTAGSMEEARRCANCKHVHKETFTSKQLMQKARDAAGFPCTGPAPVPHTPAPSRGRSAPDFLSPAEPGRGDRRASKHHAIGAGGDRRLESQHHVVARVVNSRTRNVNSVQTQQYQVEWKGGGFAWLDESDCHACKDAISAFESTPRQPPPEATSTAPNRAHQRPLVGSMSEQRVDSMRGVPRATSSKMQSIVKDIKDNTTAQCEAFAPDDPDHFVDQEFEDDGVWYRIYDVQLDLSSDTVMAYYYPTDEFTAETVSLDDCEMVDAEHVQTMLPEEDSDGEDGGALSDQWLTDSDSASDTDN